MDPVRIHSQYAIPFDSAIDRTRRVRAARQAFAVVGRTSPVLLYRFIATGQWSWAIPRSPIAAQLQATGEVVPGAPVDRCFVVERL